mmetsp:Transcript_31677/g.48480  ORF Transcript_31677/g.48480 Transcript_31677/m.48480 type:complete len:84 (+) Transcript_31677:673-924(+)
MQTSVTNRGFPAKAKSSDTKDHYKVELNREIFSKFFQVLKIQGQGLIKVNNQDCIEMEYTLDKCSYLSLLLETRGIAQVAGGN